MTLTLPNIEVDQNEVEKTRLLWHTVANRRENRTLGDGIIPEVGVLTSEYSFSGQPSSIFAPSGTQYLEETFVESTASFGKDVNHRVDGPNRYIDIQCNVGFVSSDLTPEVTWVTGASAGSAVVLTAPWTGLDTPNATAQINTAAGSYTAGETISVRFKTTPVAYFYLYRGDRPTLPYSAANLIARIPNTPGGNWIGRGGVANFNLSSGVIIQEVDKAKRILGGREVQDLTYYYFLTFVDKAGNEWPAFADWNLSDLRKVNSYEETSAVYPRKFLTGRQFRDKRTIPTATTFIGTPELIEVVKSAGFPGNPVQISTDTDIIIILNNLNNEQIAVSGGSTYIVERDSAEIFRVFVENTSGGDAEVEILAYDGAK
jgi:hypothetical protein